MFVGTCSRDHLLTIYVILPPSCFRGCVFQIAESSNKRRLILFGKLLPKTPSSMIGSIQSMLVLNNCNSVNRPMAACSSNYSPYDSARLDKKQARWAHQETQKNKATQWLAERFVLGSVFMMLCG